MGEKEQLNELGCLLGAFRDVAFSIGVEILAITLVPQAQSSIVATSAPSSLPRGHSRRITKLMALIQTFGDNMKHVGYVLTDVDLKPVAAERPGGKKEWTIRVTIGEQQVTRASTVG